MGLLRSPGGEIVSIDDGQVGSALANGYSQPSLGEAGKTTGALTQDDTGIAGGINAFTTGALSGATLGGSDIALSALLDRGQVRRIAESREQHPIAGTVGQIAGAAAPAILSGGASAAESGAGIGSRILNAAPSSVASRIGAATTGAAGELAGASTIGNIAAHGVGLATEGALYGGGDYLSQVALEDKPLSAEGFVGAMGKGALFAVPVGGAFALGGKALQRARSLFPRSEVTAQAARAVDKEATSALTQAMTDGEQMAQAAERKLSDVDANVGMAQSGETVTRRMFGGADPTALGDQVTGAVDRTQIAKALEDYQASKAQLADWIATEGDPELEAALRGMRGPGVQAPTGEGVPVGEFGAPGARGYDPGNVRAPGPPSQAPLGAAIDGTPVTRAMRKAPAPGEPTTAFDFKDSGLHFDPETRNYSGAEPKAPEPDLEALLGATKQGLDNGIPMRELGGKGPAAGLEIPKVDPHSEGFTPLRGNGEFHAFGDDEFEVAQKAYKQALTPEERADAQSYAGGARFRELNGGARQGVVHAANEQSASKLDALIAKSLTDRPLRVARVVGMEDGGEARKLWKSLKPGDVVTDGGWQSTTTNFEYANTLGDTMMIVDVPKGYPAAPLPGPHNEWELVLRRDTSYRVKSIQESDGKLFAHVEVVPAEGPPAPLKVLSRGEGAPKGEAVRVTKASDAAVAPGTDTLTGLLRGTQEGLAAGKSLSELGAPARAEYASLKATRTGEAAAKFRAKATASSADGDLMAALQGTKQGLDSGKGLREIGGHAPAEAVAAPAPREAPAVGPPQDPTGVRGLRDAIAKLHSPEAMPVNAAEYDARKAAMGAVDRPFSAAVKNHTVGKTIVDNSMRGEMAKVSDDEAIARLLGKRVGKDVNMGPGLARAAKAIGDHEAALAGLSDVLGADAPQTVVENAKAYRAAVREQHDLNAASSAKAAADIKNKVQPALDATVVDDKITQALRQHDARAAAKAPAAGAAPTSSGGLGSKLTTAGAALEVLHALGAHVPSVASIPIIGPILSLFFKAKAVMGIIGRKGGSIGQTAESMIAGKSAITRDRVNAAVGQLLDAGEKGMRKASAFAVPAAAMLGPKLFPGGEEPKGKDLASLYHARIDEIARAQAPGAIDAAIGDRIQTGDPALHDAVVAQVQKGIAFLDSKAPKQTVMPGVLPGDGTWKPSRASLEEFAKYVHAVHDPASVLEDLAKGHVTMEGAETLKVVYPKLYAEAQRALLERAPQMQATLPYARRVAVSIMFGIPVDTTMSAAHMTFLQTPTGPGSMGQSVPATPMPGQPAIIGPLQLGQQTMTSLDRRAGA